MDYRIVIGLEVHVQLLTKTKLFCGCSTEFGLPPNSATCPICIGMPGVLPVMNRRAFDLALQAATALNCRIASFTKWDRKNYYYPDLPKNYQISQYDLPFSEEGALEIETTSGSKRIGIIRVHLEEDAGKMMHDESKSGRNSLVDLNRAGTPLLEIVSKPDLDTPEDAKAYLEELADAYVPAGIERREPLISPLFAELRGFPPLLIQVGSAETLLSDATRLAEAAGVADVDVRLEIWPHMIHAWPVWNAALDDGRHALSAAGAFIGGVLR